MQNYFILNFAFMVTFVLVYTRQEVILTCITEVIIRVVYRMIELNRPKRLNFERFQEEFFNIEHGKSIELHPPDSNWGGFRGCYDYDLGYKLKFSLGICYVITL